MAVVMSCCSVCKVLCCCIVFGIVVVLCIDRAFVFCYYCSGMVMISC